MTATVVSINGGDGDDAQQLTFEGFPVESCLASFSSARNLPLESKRTYNEHVSGTFAGRIAGIAYREYKGNLVRVHVVEVLEAVFDA